MTQRATTTRDCATCGTTFEQPSHHREPWTTCLSCKRKAGAEEIFQKALSELAGSHPRNIAQLNVIKWGVLAGHSKSEVLEGVKSGWGGGRQPTARELTRAFAKAEAMAGRQAAEGPRPEPAPRKVKLSEDERRGRAARLFREPKPLSALRDSSPVPLSAFCLDEHPAQAATLLLRTLYRPEEIIFCGLEKKSRDRSLLRPAASWADEILHTGIVPEKFCTNPLTGEWGLNTESKPSLRCNATVADHRHILIESDLLTEEEQAALLLALIDKGLPVVSVTTSGGKSLHALVKVAASDRAEWDSIVRGMLFPILEVFGADSAAALSCQLSRMPGHWRSDKKRMQELLWLARPSW